MDQAFQLNGKLPPQALDLEESVLGALLLDQDAITNSIDIIKEEFFYTPEHKEIFKAINQLFHEGSPIDILTVVEQLKKNGVLDLVGGAYKISSLTDRVTSAAHIEYHARILSEKFIQRELIRLSTQTIKDAYDETNDVIDLLDKTETHLMDLSDKNFKSDFQSLDILVSDAHKQIMETIQAGGATSGVPSGFKDLDSLTSGFQKGTLIILAARPSMGKTALALSIARNMAVDFNIPVAFFSLEMTALELTLRLVSSEVEISGDRLKRGDQLTLLEQQRLNDLSKLSQAPIYIDDTSQLRIYELRAKCRRLKQKYDIKMIFIDYLQLMSGNSDGKNGNREQEISTISRQLKSLSKELGVPILALSQLSRAVEQRGGTKKPMLSDLRESGAIEQDADIVMFIYRPEYYGETKAMEENNISTEGLAVVNIAKHRSGPVGEVNLRFENKYAKFVNFDSSNKGYSPLGANDNFGNTQPMATILPSKMNDDDDLPEDDELPI
ncbi:MAG: replicative DNA helicase [Bacteroidales bacterium]|nr:replicative DNA helicase [Bacteroidales bacterium]